jgi:type IV pilus assembly protein PilA
MRDAVMKRIHLQNQSGFTLFELVIVVAIIGILAAIAIPQFAGYRQKGVEATLRSDLKNAAFAEEAYFAQHRTYKSGLLSGSSLEGYNKSQGIIGMNAVVGANTFTLTATHANCSGIIWLYNSATATVSGSPCS